MGVLAAQCHPSSQFRTTTAVLKEGGSSSWGEWVIWPSGKALGWLAEGPRFNAASFECCLTSRETVGLLGTGVQDGHLDFHTAPELGYTASALLSLQKVVVCGVHKPQPSEEKGGPKRYIL